MIDLYVNSSTLTKIIIGTFWFIVGIQMYRVFLWENKIIQPIILFFFYGIYYFIIEFFTAINSNIYVLIYVIPSFMFAIIFFFLDKYLVSITPVKPLVVEIPLKNGVKIKIDVVKGISVHGAAGSGKTISIAAWLLLHFGKNNVGGLLYDYKDFELVELANFCYKDAEIPVLPFAPYNPSKSIQYNPIDLSIIKSHEDIKVMSKCIVDNVINDKKNSTGGFFSDAAEGAITGAIYTLKEFYPKQCSFTYLIAIFIIKDTESLIKFIEKSQNGSIHARAFLDSATAEKQMAGIKATLSNAFSKFANPNIFYTLQKNSVDFSINEKHNKALLCLVNKPKYDDIYSPILSVVAQSLIMKMSARDREESFILLDEAPTLKISRIGKVPATMRSFNVATIYMLQDTIQATVSMGKEKMKEIFANLSTMCFGKTNDPDTAKFYESYFDEKTIKKKSISFKSGGFGSNSDKRTSVSENQEKEHKSHEMFKRDTGEFFIIDSKGKTHDGKIKKPKIKMMPSHIINKVSNAKIEANYNHILEVAKNL